MEKDKSVDILRQNIMNCVKAYRGYNQPRGIPIGCDSLISRQKMGVSYVAQLCPKNGSIIQADKEKIGSFKHWVVQALLNIYLTTPIKNLHKLYYERQLGKFCQ